MKKRLLAVSGVLAAMMLCGLAYLRLADARPRPRLGMTEQEVEQLMGPAMDPPITPRPSKLAIDANAWQTTNGGYYVEFQKGRVSLVRFVPNRPAIWNKFREWAGW